MDVNLTNPVFTDEMKEAAIYALQNEFFVFGESVYKFEEEFAKFIGTNHAVSVNSGTFALFSSMIALGIGKENSVLTTPMSFIATANSIIHSGAKPIFSDINRKTGNIDIDKINLKNGKIHAIVPVHLYGNPCEMEKLSECQENNIPVIEDACQAHGAQHKGKMIGSIGDVGCFSFYTTKNMTVCGDGGMVTTNSDEIAEKIRMIRDHGRKSKNEHSIIGYTARLNTVNAAIGRVQLKYLPGWIKNRREIASKYQIYLPKEILLKENDNGKHVYHIFAIQSEKRDKIMSHLSQKGIQTAVHYPIPIHLQPIYRKTFGYSEGKYPETERFSKTVLSLPMYPEMTNDQVKFVCESVLEAILC